MLSLVIYAGCFGEVLEEIEELGPFDSTSLLLSDYYSALFLLLC